MYKKQDHSVKLPNYGNVLKELSNIGQLTEA